MATNKMYVNDIHYLDIGHFRTGFQSTVLTKHSIVVGNVDGQLSEIFSKLAKLHEKNSFAFAIIAGNLFADESSSSDVQKQELLDLVNGNIPVPFPTYFAIGKRPLPAPVVEKLTNNGGELCPNLSILGRKCSIKTSEGFKIVAIGGAHVSADDAPMDQYAATYSDKDVEAAKEFKDCDLLITSDWPAEVRDGSTVAYTGDSPVGVSGISELCTALKPRYHFSTSEYIYQREAFFHRGSTPRKTHFVSLAAVNNAHKQKAIFAFSMEPNPAPPPSLDGCTASPFIKTSPNKKRKADEVAGGSQNEFRFANGNGHSFPDRRFREPKRRRNQARPKPTEKTCFFCLGRDDVEDQMITSIADIDAYMTIAKGPLSTRDTFPALDHPMHMLIMPVTHTATFAALSEEEREAALPAMNKYREALHTFISSKSTTGADGEAQLGAVTWEISKAKGVHLHWQFLPVPVDMVKKDLIQMAFEVEADNLNYPKFVKNEAEIAEKEKDDYLKVMIWSESSQKEILLPITQSYHFDLQFPRKVLAKLLKLEDRIEWRDVAQSKGEETSDRNAFRKMFKPYDWTRVGEPDTEPEDEPKE